MAVVKRIGLGSAFKIGLVLYGIVGLCLGIFVAILSSVMGPLGGLAGGNPAGVQSWDLRSFGFGMGIGAVLFFPLCYGIIGGLFAAVSAAVYNLVARLVGGLEVDIS